MHQLFAYNTVQSGGGVGLELLYIVAAVVGGCLLTGGYGSVIGAAIGALIFGMVSRRRRLRGLESRLVPVLPRSDALARHACEHARRVTRQEEATDDGFERRPRGRAALTTSASITAISARSPTSI